jgi:4'-phosphopantetheinyl transferase
MPANALPQSAPPPLGFADLHVWTVALDGRSPSDDACSAAEHARAARFVRPRDAAAFLQAHDALRRILARYVGGAPRALDFAAGIWGKPELAGAAADAGIAFNLTHSGDCALIAIARDRSVGIDVELGRAMPEAAGIARRILGEEAAAALAPLAGDARDELFFQLWTAHEACIKAVGRALAVASDAVRIALRNDTPVCTWADPAAAPHGLALAPLASAPGHVAAVAWARRAPAEAAPAIVQFDWVARQRD